jgi:SAM-dependent methyltransferase
MTLPPVLLKGDELLESDPGAQYDKSRDLSKYLLMHYGSFEEMFDRTPHPLADAYGYCQRLSDLLRVCAERTGTTVARALDVGCNVGGLSHALGRWVTDEVVGIDASMRSVGIAQTLTEHGGGSFCVIEEGPFYREVHVRVPEPEDRARVRFEVGDGNRLRAHRPGAFDAVVLSNVLDRVWQPEACLEQLSASADVLRDGGLLMVSCPWAWFAEFSHPSEWLGSAANRTPSAEVLKTMLSADFDLLAEANEPGVLRENAREYNYFESHVTVWRKR